MTRARSNLSRVTNLISAALIAAALVVPLITFSAPLGSWFGSLGEQMSLPAVPTNTPHWTADYAARFPGCSPTHSEQPVPVVVVTQDNDALRVPFAEAWERTHNETWADDVWVVGYCH